MTERVGFTRCSLCHASVPRTAMSDHLYDHHGQELAPQPDPQSVEDSLCSVCTRPIPMGVMSAHMSSYHGDQGNKPAPVRQTPSDDEDRSDPDSHVRVPMWLVIGLVLVAFIIFVKWSDSREDFRDVDPTRQGCSTAFGNEDC
jgi:hypothetical protein